VKFIIPANKKKIRELRVKVNFPNGNSNEMKIIGKPKTRERNVKDMELFPLIFSFVTESFIANPIPDPNASNTAKG
jgi:hypothetical protein